MAVLGRLVMVGLLVVFDGGPAQLDLHAAGADAGPRPREEP